MAPTRLSRGPSSLGVETGLTVSSAVLPGGGLRPAQQPGGGPAAVGGREAQDASTPGQAAEADGGRLPVAEAGMVHMGLMDVMELMAMANMARTIMQAKTTLL